MAKGNHSFTEQDIRKRFGAIVGHTVAEVDTAGVLTASAASRNKGRIGAVIEQSVLGYPADSDRRPDIVIDGQPWEVKATGLKESARGGWCAKEPMSITAVAPEGMVTESFSTSAFWHKAERLLVVYYLYVRPGRGVAVEYAGFEFKGYDLHTWREVDRCRLEADWTVVRDFVRIALAGDVDTARYSKEHIIETCERLGFDIDFSRLPEPEECLDDMARAAESALEENKENSLEGEHGEEIPF